jgi:hypothetical protein
LWIEWQATQATWFLAWLLGNASHMGGLIQMAGEADLVGRRGSELRGIADIGRASIPRACFPDRGRIRRLCRFKSALLVGFHLVVRVLLEGVEDVLVARLAGFGADVFRRLRRFLVERERSASS